MAGKPVGTIFAELALDVSSYTKSQREILASASQTALNVEKNWKIIGEKSDVMYDAMRQRIENAYQRIAHSATATQQEIVRAQQAAAEKIKQIDTQQYGHQATLLDSMKKNYIAAAAVATAAWMAVNKAMEYVEAGAEAMQVKSSFGIIAKEYGADADGMIESMKRLTKNTVDDSQLQQKAVKMMLAGYNPEQIEKFSGVAIAASQYMGVAVGEAFDMIADSLSSRMPKAMVKSGAVTKEQMGIVSEAIKAGAESTVLMDLAIANLSVKQLMLQGTQDGATLAIQRFHAQTEETKEAVGVGLLVALQKLYGVFQYLAAGTLGLTANMAGLVSVYARYRQMVYEAAGDEEKAAKNRKFADDAMVVSKAAWEARNDLVRKSKDNIVGEADAEARASAQSIANAKANVAAKMKELQFIIDRKQAGEASAKEREALNKRIVEDNRKTAAEIAGIGLTTVEKEAARIQSQADAWKKAGADRAAIAQWVANETVLAQAKQDAEIVRMEIEVAASVQKIRDGQTKAALAELTYRAEASLKFYTDQESALKEYQRIVTEAQDWSIDEHQRSINRIQSSEAQSIETMKKMYAAGFIGISELFAGINAVREASAIATDAQIMKTLADQTDFYSQITGYEDEYRKKQLEWIDKEAKRRAEAYKDDVAAAKWAAEEKGKLEQTLFEKKASEVHKGLVDMAAAFSAIGSMYDKSSSEYARMQEAAKAMIVLQQAVAVANAVAAIANQGLGDPYSAFARIAAMAAAMGSLLASAGLSLGGGGESSAPILPTSTVLGAEAGTGSESASKSYELLKDTYALEYRELTGIHDSMKELNRNITGLVTSIVRTGGVGSIGTIPGSTDSFGGSFVSNYAQAAFNSVTLGLLGGLGDTIGNWIGSAYNSVFGGGSSASQTAGGIQFGGSSVGGLLAGGGMNARQFAEITTTTKGGWFHGDSTSVEMRYQALDAQVSDMLDMVFRDTGKTLVELAKGLGTDTQAALEYVFAGAKINLQGKTTEEINKAISEFISNTADNAVEALFGEMLRGYQQLNEGLLETAVRLLRDKTVILETLEMTNQAFVGTTAEAIAFSEAIINIAGDLDTLTKAASTYFDKFFTDAEKQARLQGQLTDALSAMGMALPTARDGYRALVEGLDLTTDAGKQAYVTLLNLAEGADKFYSAQEDALKTAQDKYLAAQKAYLDEQVQIWDAQLKAQQTLVNGLKSRVESVTGWIAGIKTSTTAAVGSAQAWQAEYARQKEMASGAGASDAAVSGFLGYAKTYLDFQKKFAGGNYLDTYNSVLADVKSIGDLAAGQIPAAEQQLTAIQSADDAARAAAAAQLSATQETNATLLAMATDALIKAGGTPNLPAHAAGGLTSGPTISGEMGREWNVPTYEPQRSRFLRDVGADPDAIGRAVARHLGGLSGAGDGKDINVNLYIDGKQVTTAVVRGIRGGDQELIKGLRKAVA